MGMACSTFYEQPLAAHDDTAIVEAIAPRFATSSKRTAGDACAPSCAIEG
jgi:hypothetical protein